MAPLAAPVGLELNLIHAPTQLVSKVAQPKKLALTYGARAPEVTNVGLLTPAKYCTTILLRGMECPSSSAGSPECVASQHHDAATKSRRFSRVSTLCENINEPTVRRGYGCEQGHRKISHAYHNYIASYGWFRDNRNALRDVRPKSNLENE